MTNAVVIKLLLAIVVMLAVIAGVVVRRDARDQKSEQNIRDMRATFRHEPAEAKPVVSPDVWQWKAK